MSVAQHESVYTPRGCGSQAAKSVRTSASTNPTQGSGLWRQEGIRAARFAPSAREGGRSLQIDIYFAPTPHARQIRRILRALSRARADTVRESSPTFHGVEFMVPSKTTATVRPLGANPRCDQRRRSVDAVILPREWTLLAAAA